MYYQEECVLLKKWCVQFSQFVPKDEHLLDQKVQERERENH